VTLRRTLTGVAPALRAASPGERRLARHVGDGQEPRRLDHRHAEDRVDVERRDVQVRVQEAREIAARAPHHDPAEDDAERRQQQRQQRQAAEDLPAREIGSRDEDRHDRPRDDGERRRERGVLERVHGRLPELRVGEQAAIRADREGPAALVERAVADRRVEERQERAQDEGDDDDPRQPLQRPRSGE
jgi:hypothetical protein